MKRILVFGTALLLGAAAFTLAQPSQIVALGQPNETKIVPEVRQIDCTGKFILPGYIDTHVHFF